MASKIFLDANMLLDLTLKRDFYSEAKRVFDLIINGSVRAFTTTSVIHITGHYLTKSFGSAKAKKIILMLLLDITIIDVPHEIAIVAISSNIADIEDALQYYAAIHHKVDYFISSDKLLQKRGLPILPVYTPSEFLEEFA